MRLAEISLGTDTLYVVLYEQLKQVELSARIACAIAEAVATGKQGSVSANAIKALHAYRDANLIGIASDDIVRLAIECEQAWLAATAPRSDMYALLADCDEEEITTRFRAKTSDIFEAAPAAPKPPSPGPERRTLALVRPIRGKR